MIDAIKSRRAQSSTSRVEDDADVVFLAVMLATSGLAFLLENLRPRQREPGDTTGLPSAALRSP